MAVSSSGSTWAEGGPLARQRRHVLQLCELVSVHTNRPCFDYNNYGCFCGLGNADSPPVDAVDSCCRAHDQCYGDIACFWLYPHFVGYSYECTSAGCKCTDSPTEAPCSYGTCKCDMKLARCLARSEFNPGFSNYNRDQCVQPANNRKSRKKKSIKKAKASRPMKIRQKKNSKGKTAKKKQRRKKQQGIVLA
ncbi:hypothetical protein BsWGS_22674 [Bradybaena similaris]